MQRTSIAMTTARFDSTYEGLKQERTRRTIWSQERFDSTYEGLKRYLLIVPWARPQVSTVPMRA